MTAAVFRSGSKTLVLGNDVGQIFQWDTASRREIGRPWTVHGLDHTNIQAISANSKIAAVLSENRNFGDPEISAWNIATRREVGPRLTAFDLLAMSPDGQEYAEGDGDGVLLQDSITGRVIGRMVTPGMQLEQALFSSSWNILATVESSGISGASDVIQIWNVATRKQIGASWNSDCCIPYGQPGPIAISPDGNILATTTAHGNRPVRVWNVITHRETGAPLNADVGGSTADNINGIAFTANGQDIVTQYAYSPARLWNVHPHRQVGAPIPIPFDISTGNDSSSFVFSPDGRLLVINGDVFDLRVYRQAGQPLADSDGPSRFIFVPHRNLVLSPGVGVWNLATRRKVTVPWDAGQDTLWLSANGSTAITTYSDESTGIATIMFRSTATGTQVRKPMTVSVPHRWVSSVIAISPDGRFLAACVGPPTRPSDSVRIYSLATGKEVGRPIQFGLVFTALFSPDSATLAIVDQKDPDGLGAYSLTLWNAAAQRRIATITPGPDWGADNYAFSPDSRLIATVNTAGAQIWNASTGQEVSVPMIGDLTAMSAVAFSPDGKLIATTEDTGAIRLWDVATDQQIGPTIYGNESDIDAVVFSPSGKLLITGGGNNLAQLWDVAFTGDVVSAVCALISPDITRQQWEADIGDVPYQRVCPR